MVNSRFGTANLIRGICNAIRRLDVVQRPSSPSFRYELPAKNLVSVRKEHRMVEDGDVHDLQQGTYSP